MKKLLVFVLSVLCVVGYSQSVIDKTLKPFNKLSVQGKIILNVYPSNDNKIILKGKISNAANESLVINEKKGNLYITRKEPFSFKKQQVDSIVLDIFVESPNYIIAKEKAEVYFGKRFTLDAITIETSSTASVAAIVEAKKANLDASSSSKILLSGKADNVFLKATGSAYVNTVQTDCVSLTAVSNTNAEAYVRAVDLLDLKVATSGNIFHKGIAKEIVKNVSTFGTIEKF